MAEVIRIARFDEAEADTPVTAIFHSQRVDSAWRNGALVTVLQYGKEVFISFGSPADAEQFLLELANAAGVVKV